MRLLSVRLYSVPEENIMKLVREKKLLEDLPLSARGLWNLRRKKIIPYLKVGRCVMYNPSAVERALQRLEIKSQE